MMNSISNSAGIMPFNTFSVLASNWVANADTTTNADYPYIYEISSTIYSANSIPIWDLAGAGTIPTANERDTINMILEAVFTANGITLYATDEPQANLTLRVKGK